MKLTTVITLSIGVTSAMAGNPELPPASLAPNPPAKCADQTTGAPCKIGWDFVGNQRNHYWTQRWDSENVLWKTLEHSESRAVFNTGQNAVEAGHLYRVLGCNDAARSSGCITSTAVWAPVWPDNVDEIPETVDVELFNGEIETFQVSKTLDLEGQTAQYNIYLMVKELALVGGQNLPPMAKPYLTVGVPDTPTEVVDMNVYMSYEKLRAGYLDNPERWKPDPSTRPENN